VVPNAAYSSATSTFTSSSLTWNPTNNTLTITIGGQASGTVATNVTAGKPKYTPSASITDLAGNAMATTQFPSTVASGF
jgi:hypothetical protein